MHLHGSIRRASLTACALLLAAPLAGLVWAKDAALTNALNLIPADVPVAVVVPSLSGLNQKIAAVNDQALGGAVPQMADLVGQLKAQVGVGAGFNDDGSLVVFMTGMGGLDDGPEHVVVLAPVSDYAAFVSNLGGDGHEAVTTLALPNGSSAFAKRVNDFAVLGDDRATTEAYQPGQAAAAWEDLVGTVGNRCLESSDATVIVNIQVMAPALQEQLKAARANMVAHLDQPESQPPAMDPSMQRMSSAFLGAYFDAFNAVLRDTSALVIGLGITDQGVRLTQTAQFKPGSHLAKHFTTGGGAAGQLARLPKQPYLIAGAINHKGIAFHTMVDALLARLPANEDSPMMKMAIEGIQLWGQVKGMAMAYYTPSQQDPQQVGLMGGGMIGVVAMLETEDGQAYLDTYKAMITRLNGIGMAIGDPAALPAAAAAVTARYTSDVLQIDGVQVDEYLYQYNFPPEIMQQMGPMAHVMTMVGATGQNGYIAAKGPFVVMTSTRDTQMMKQALASVEHNSGLGSDGPIQRVRQASVPANAISESYLSVPEIMGTVNTFVGMMMGMPPIQVAEDLPPIAVAASVEDHGVVTRLYVPMSVVQFGQEVVGQAMMMIGGGHPQGMGPGPTDSGGAEPDHGHQHGPPPAPF